MAWVGVCVCDIIGVYISMYVKYVQLVRMPAVYVSSNQNLLSSFLQALADQQLITAHALDFRSLHETKPLDIS